MCLILKFNIKELKSDCRNKKKLIYYYKINQGKWNEIKNLTKIVITKNIRKIAIKAERNNKIHAFSLEGLNKKITDKIDVKWNKRYIDWILTPKKIPKRNEEIPLILTCGETITVCIEYEFKPNSKAHLLCKKEDGDKMHVLGPKDEEDKDNKDNQKKNLLSDTAEIELGIGEKIHCVGISGKNLVEPKFSIKNQKVYGLFQFNKIKQKSASPGENPKIWEITLLDVKQADVKKKNSSKDEEPKTNVTMGVDEPGTDTSGIGKRKGI